MHKIIFTEKAINILEKYILSYREIYLNLYSDTWIYYEGLIKDNYLENSNKFYYDVKSDILNILQEKTIFWYKVLENKSLQVVVSAWNYKLFVEYSENSEERFVENIIFNRK